MRWLWKIVIWYGNRFTGDYRLSRCMFTTVIIAGIVDYIIAYPISSGGIPFVGAMGATLLLALLLVVIILPIEWAEVQDRLDKEEKRGSKK